jgi:uncharacterized protein YggE
MKKAILIGLAAVLGLTLLAATGCFSPVDAATAAEAAPPKAVSGTSITASGEGYVTVRPDVAYLSAGVTVMKENAADAASMNAEVMTAVIEAIKAVGIAADDIQTSSYSIWPQYDYSKNTPALSGYQAENRVSVVVRDISKIADVIDAAVAAGANDTSRISFDLLDRTEAYNEALAQAVENAAAKVTVMANAATLEGTPVPVKIGEATYTTYNDFPVAVKQEAAYDAAGGTPIEAGQMYVKANVAVEFFVGD